MKLLYPFIMKDVRNRFGEQNVLKKKIQRLEKQLISRHWIGWAGGYSNSKKK